jgi:hypothetical protein
MNNAIENYFNNSYNNVVSFLSKVKNTWTAKSRVNNVTFMYDKDASKNRTLAYIAKYAYYMVLEKYKEDLENFDIKVKFSNVKRNKNGQIKTIKISVQNEQGD